jgi:hypothetical protein
VQAGILRDISHMVQCVTQNQSRDNVLGGHFDALYGAQDSGDDVDFKLDSAPRVGYMSLSRVRRPCLTILDAPRGAQGQGWGTLDHRTRSFPSNYDATRQPSIHNMNITNKHGLQLVCVPDVKCLFVHVREQ